MTRLALAAATGSVIGALGRYAVALVTPTDWTFPVATLVVNLAGALAIGLIAATPAIMSHDLRRHFAVTGVLGGFTTFSALALETVRLAHQPAFAVVYIALTFGGGLAATHLGMKVRS